MDPTFLNIKDIKTEFWDQFRSISDEFEDGYTDALKDIRDIADKLIHMDLRKDRTKYKTMVEALTKDLEWLGSRELDNVIDQDKDLCLFNDEYEITFIKDVMVIHNSQYHIDLNGQRVPYLAPDCFVSTPDVRYVE